MIETTDSQLPAKGDRVVVAMSGGVDSSVVAALLHERGCEVIGITLSLHKDLQSREGGCCTPEDVRDARQVCAHLGVRHYVLNYRDAFEAAVVRPFVEAYRTGQTPNPCVLCNHVVKFDKLLRRARDLEASWLATGHYARIRRNSDGSLQLARGLDPAKDQSYFLYGIRQEVLPSLTFPLGDLDKDLVREEARRLGLRNFDKADSQDVCFIPPGRTADFVRNQGGAGAPGEIQDETGRILGSHDGVHGFTIGQRKGLGLASEHPLYVLQINAPQRRIVVGSSDRLEARVLSAVGWNWLRRPAVGEPTVIKIRYRSAPSPVAEIDAADDAVRIALATPARAIAPGQAAVLYGGPDGQEVLGGGTIQASGSA